MQAEQLRKLREITGLSTLELARRARMSRFRLWQAETGLIQLEPAELARVSRELKPYLAEAVTVIATYQREGVTV